MRRSKDNIYAMCNLDDEERRMKRKKQTIGMALLVLITLLVITIVCIIQNIQDMQRAKEFSGQLVQYQEQKKQELEAQQREEEKRVAEEKARQEKIAEVSEEAKHNIETIYRSETKRAFLTFDDGPSIVTPTILQVLKEKNVKATFFMLGSNVQKLPETVKQVYAEGHYIANHGYSHVYSAIYASPQSVLDEYNQTNQAIQTAIGEPEFNSHLFRFPGGYAGGKYAAIKQQAKDVLQQNAIYHVDWNCLTGDAETSTPTPEYTMNRLQATSAGKNSLVILMHDAQAKKVTADMLPQIIDYLAGQGYEFKTFYDIF